MSQRLLRDRLTAQLLAGAPAANPVAVVEHLLAVQAQDPRGFRLAIRARTRGLTVAAVEQGLSVDRTLLVTWLNRGTLHLVRSEDYPWLHALTTPPLLVGNARRLGQEGVTPRQAERGVQVIVGALAGEGPLHRHQLRSRLDAAGIPTAGQALVHLLMLASLRGRVVRGPLAGSQHAYVLTHDWLGEFKPVARERALAELARRYLRGHGPASDRDLALWAGLPLRDARAGLRAIAAELAEREDGLLQLAVHRQVAPLPPPRLLGSFDPLLLGWVSRAPLLGDEERRLVTVNGLFRPFALVAGRAVATWGLASGTVTLAPFAPISEAAAAALEVEAADVLRFLGLREREAAAQTGA